MENQPKTHHRTRYYIVLTTMVIAGIFFLLLVNDKNGWSFTGSTIKIFEEGRNKSAALSEEKASLEEVIFSKKETEKYSREMELVLSFSRIPTVRKEARIKEMELRFDDLTTSININNDKLELNNLQQVTMKVGDFEGKMDLNNLGFSLDGSAKLLEVNGMSLSSRGKIKIAFNNLDYNYLNVEDIELKELELQRGDGTLMVGEKLNYVLEQEDLTLYYFNGKITLNQQNESAVSLEGVAKGVSVSGALLDVKVK